MIHRVLLVGTVITLTATVLVGSFVSGIDATAAAKPSESDLPPATRAAIAAIFAKDLERLGLRTTRALLQDRTSYQPSPTGTHLAVYVEPIDPADVTARQRVDAIVPLAQVFLPSVFRRWSDLESFDVCQEDDVETIPGAVPPPITQLVVTRKGAARVGWSDASLGDFVEAAATTSRGSDEGWGDPRLLFLYVGPDAQRVPAYRRARRSAGLTASVPVPTTTITTSVPPP